MAGNFPTCELGEVAELYDSLHQTPQYADEGYPMIRVTDIRRGFVNTAGAVRVNEETYLQFSKKHRPKVGDILFSRVGSYGNSSYVNRDEEFCLGQNTVCISPEKSRIEPTFLYSALNSDDLRQQIESFVGGASQGTISLKSIRLIQVPLPPLPVQRRIAGILSAYDELMENSQRRIRLLEAMARALYREWFVHFRFPGHEKVKMVHPDSHPSEGSAKMDGDIPQGWEVKPFSAIASYVNGYPFKPAQLGTEGKPIIKIKELKAGIVADTPRNLGDEIPEKYNIHDGDVLFSWSADLDTYLWMGGDGLLNQHLFNVVPFDGISRAFCFHALKGSMPRFRALSLGATMHHIKRSALDQVFTLLPPAALRKRFETLVEPMHQQLITLTKHVENLRRTRDLLLPRLLSGQVNLTTN